MLGVVSEPEFKCLDFFSSGDIERLRMQSTEGEAEKQALRERIDQLMRSQQELESRSTSLQLTVDRLTLALAKTEEEEQAFKEKVIYLVSSRTCASNG